MNWHTITAQVKNTLTCIVRSLSEWAWRDELHWWFVMHADACRTAVQRGNALMMARETILSNKRHLESMGRNCVAGTHETLDEIDNAFSPPNAEAHGRAVARTVQPLVGASGGSDAT